MHGFAKKIFAKWMCCQFSRIEEVTVPDHMGGLQNLLDLRQGFRLLFIAVVVTGSDVTLSNWSSERPIAGMVERRKRL